MPEGSVPVSDDDPVVDPPNDWFPAYRGTLLRAPTAAVRVMRESLTELTGPLLGDGRVGEHDHDLTRSTRASRWASGSSSTAACSTATAARSRHARGGLAGERRRPYAHGGDTPRAARPQLLRRGPLPHRRRGAIPVRHDQARRVSVEEPRERVAAGAHPLLAVRPRVHPAARSPRCTSPTTRCSPRTRSSTRSPTRRARERLISRSTSPRPMPEWALAFRWDIVLRGGGATPLEEEDDDA